MEILLLICIAIFILHSAIAGTGSDKKQYISIVSLITIATLAWAIYANLTGVHSMFGITFLYISVCFIITVQYVLRVKRFRIIRLSEVAGHIKNWKDHDAFDRYAMLLWSILFIGVMVAGAA